MAREAEARCSFDSYADPDDSRQTSFSSTLFFLFITLSHMVLRDAISGMHRAQRNICTPKAHAARFHYPRSTLDGRFYPLFVQLLIAFAQSHKSSDVSSASRGRLWENWHSLRTCGSDWAEFSSLSGRWGRLTWKKVSIDVPQVLPKRLKKRPTSFTLDSSINLRKHFFAAREPQTSRAFITRQHATDLQILHN